MTPKCSGCRGIKHEERVSWREGACVHKAYQDPVPVLEAHDA